MAGMSPEDKTFMDKMGSAKGTCVQVAKEYLAANPAKRNARLSEMARATMKGDMDMMMKMRDM